ncbi:venom allergen 5-like [Copidosoma floridanum]|uniref:venom allergen 5-like n=1 Tax=Copidosoma floridanum TaxID=29053 RepID=UPI000C6F4CC2|nr:venom allergen 5-like [Copidosoma floridanum]
MNCPVQLIVAILMIKSAYSQVTTSNDIPGTLKCEGCSIYKLTENDKKEILFAHNSLRDKLSQGIEGMGNPRPQLKAINLEHLQWDEVLEEEAWNELYSCSSDPDFRKCFTDLSNPVTGHNYDYIVNPFNSSDSVLSIVKKWSSQANTFNHEHASSLTTSDLTVARAYTQMVWSRSTKIGCAAFKEKIVEYTDMTHLICKYREPGNIIGQPVYFTSSTVLHQPPTGINSMTTSFKTNIPNLPTNDGQVVTGDMTPKFNTNIPKLMTDKLFPVV